MEFHSAATTTTTTTIIAIRIVAKELRRGCGAELRTPP
jgi:hypothetical protein